MVHSERGYSAGSEKNPDIRSDVRVRQQTAELLSAGENGLSHATVFFPSLIVTDAFLMPA
jgi:hypothetical protein